MIVHFRRPLRKASRAVMSLNPPIFVWRAAMSLRPSITHELPTSRILQTNYQSKQYSHPQRRLLSSFQRVFRSWSPEEIAHVIVREQRKVNDPESVISEEERLTLEKISRNCTRHDAAVVIVTKMKPSFVISVDRDIDAAAKMFAGRVRELWGIDEEYEKGVIIFLFIEDRAVFISTNSTTENAGLNNTVLQNIISNMRSYLRAGKYASAAEYAITEIDAVLGDVDYTITAFSTTDYAKKSSYKNSEKDKKNYVVLLKIFLFFAFLILVIGSVGTMKIELTTLESAEILIDRLYDPDRITEEASSLASCPHCLKRYDTRATETPLLCGGEHVVCASCSEILRKSSSTDKFAIDHKHDASCNICANHEKLFRRPPLLISKDDELGLVLYRLNRFYDLHKPHVKASDIEELRKEILKGRQQGLIALEGEKISIRNRIKQIHEQERERARERSAHSYRRSRYDDRSSSSSSSSSSSNGGSGGSGGRW